MRLGYFGHLMRRADSLEKTLILGRFFFLFYFIFKLYIIVLVLPNIKMNPPQVGRLKAGGEGDNRGWDG